MNDFKLTTEIVRTGHVTGPESEKRFNEWIASEHRKSAINILDTAANALAELPPHALLEPGLRVAVETLRTMSREIANRDTP